MPSPSPSPFTLDQVSFSLQVSSADGSPDTEALRTRVAAMLAGVTPDQVRVTIVQVDAARRQLDDYFGGISPISAHDLGGISPISRRSWRHLAGTMSGGSIYRADIAIGTYNEYVAQTASTTIDELIVSAGEGGLSDALGVSVVQVVASPTSSVVFVQSPAPPPRPPERPLSEWSREYGSEPGAILIRGTPTHTALVTIIGVTFSGFDAQHGGGPRRLATRDPTQLHPS